MTIFLCVCFSNLNIFCLRSPCLFFHSPFNISVLLSVFLIPPLYGISCLSFLAPSFSLSLLPLSFRHSCLSISLFSLSFDISVCLFFSLLSTAFLSVSSFSLLSTYLSFCSSRLISPFYCLSSVSPFFLSPFYCLSFVYLSFQHVCLSVLSTYLSF
jgi:hypothetical protein